jgi:hypothetical protein
MKREQLEHVLRASAAIAQERSFVVDADFVRALLRHRMIDAQTLENRLRALDASKWPVENLVTWARRRAAEATP